MKRRGIITVIVILLLAPWSLWTAFQVLLVCEESESDSAELFSMDDASITTRDNRRKPLFVMHVGPPKTGTTTIQWYAGEHQDLLQQNKIHYLGEYRSQTELDVHGLCFSCIMEKKDDCALHWNELEFALDKHYKLGHDVLISDENFSRFGTHEQEHLWNYLLPILEKNQWNVRILFTYRRLYEWIPSWYYEYYNPNGARGKKKKRFLLWPETKARGIPSFATYFDAYIQQAYEMVSSVDKWRDRFQDVRVLNMHSGAEYVETFFCQLIPEAKQICKFVRQQDKSTASSKNLSASKDLHHDMLAVEAHRRGWIQNSSLDRTTVRKAVERHFKQKMGYTSLQHFPLQCLSEKQAKLLLDLSLQLESNLVPNFHASPNGKTQLKAGFQKSMETKKFCSVNTDEALKDPRLRTFFESL